jgi:hypothetical protein
MLIYNTGRVCLVRVLLGQVRENNRCQEAQIVTFAMDEDFIAFGVDEEKDQGGDSGESAAPALLTSIPAPWLAYGYQYDKRAPPFVRLHNEILTCCEYIAPSLHEMKQREIVLAEITDIIQSLWPKSTVQVFGSQMTKILTPTSDLDLVVMGVIENKRDSTKQYPSPFFGSISARCSDADISTAVLHVRNISWRGVGFASRLIVPVRPFAPLLLSTSGNLAVPARVPSNRLWASSLARCRADLSEISAGRSHFSGLEGFSRRTSISRSSC